ncbi:MAG TPA: hypothetical protein ENK28_08575 [Aliiroseovarius sp.]|nr:hypothetical protein [Aliiroseovarius sp.]
MPKLISLYIRQVFVGFGLSAVFVAILLIANVGNLWHLVSTSPMGWIAVAMLFMFHGAVFAGVQFAIVIMRMEDNDDGPSGGKRQPVATNIPVRVKAEAAKTTLPFKKH